MRLSFITALAAIGLAQGKLNQIKTRDLKTSDAGAYHTEGFEQLAELYSKKKPSSKLEMILDVSTIASSFCPKGDELCKNNAYKFTLEQFQDKKQLEEVEYPKNFDQRIKNAMDETLTVISNKDNLDIDSVVEKLTQLEDSMTEMKDIDENNRVVGLATVSVAIESAKLWHAVDSDETHPLHAMRGHFNKNNNRKLQNSIVRIDAVAALNAGINAVNNDAQVLSVWPNIIIKVIPNAYAASVRAAFIDVDESLP